MEMTGGISGLDEVVGVGCCCWVEGIGWVGEIWEGEGAEGSVTNGLIIRDGGTFRIDDGTP